MVSNKLDAEAKFRSHLFDDNKVPNFFQPGFQPCPPIALVDAEDRPIVKHRAQKGDPEND